MMYHLYADTKKYSFWSKKYGRYRKAIMAFWIMNFFSISDGCHRSIVNDIPVDSRKRVNNTYFLLVLILWVLCSYSSHRNIRSLQPRLRPQPVVKASATQKSNKIKFVGIQPVIKKTAATRLSFVVSTIYKRFERRYEMKLIFDNKWWFHLTKKIWRKKIVLAHSLKFFKRYFGDSEYLRNWDV